MRSPFYWKSCEGSQIIHTVIDLEISVIIIKSWDSHMYQRVNPRAKVINPNCRVRNPTVIISEKIVLKE